VLLRVSAYMNKTQKRREALLEGTREKIACNLRREQTKKSAGKEKKGRLSFIRNRIGKEQRQAVGRGRERERVERESRRVSTHQPTHKFTHTIHSHTCDDLDC